MKPPSIFMKKKKGRDQLVFPEQEITIIVAIKYISHVSTLFIKYTYDKLLFICQVYYGSLWISLLACNRIPSGMLIVPDLIQSQVLILLHYGSFPVCLNITLIFCEPSFFPLLLPVWVSTYCHICYVTSYCCRHRMHLH